LESGIPALFCFAQKLLPSPLVFRLSYSGQPVEVVADMDKMHIFDRESEKALV